MFSLKTLRNYILLALLALLALVLCPAVLAQEKLTYTPVPGHKAVQPGEHPRLLFRKSDLPEIRRRAQTPEGKKLVARLKATLGGGEVVPTERHTSYAAYKETLVLPEGAYSISHAAGFGMLYQLTGDKKYAELAKECMELGFALVRDRDSQARYVMIIRGLTGSECKLILQGAAFSGLQIVESK